MKPVGAVRRVPAGQVYKQIFQAEVQLVRSLKEARNRAKVSIRSEKLTLDRNSASSTAARLLAGDQQREVPAVQKVQGSPTVTAAEEVRGLPDVVAAEPPPSGVLAALWERRWRRHHGALTLLYQELGCIAREMEPLVLKPQQSLLAKLVESDRKVELLLQKIEADTALGGFSFEELEELWASIHQESLSRKKWIREMDESLRKVEWTRTDKVTAVLRSYTVRLEEISYLLSPDVHRLINHEAMLINRALLANQRAMAQLLFKLLKSELKWKLSHQLKWQEAVKAWKLIQKDSIVHSFREFMAKEEIQNPPGVKREMEKMIMDQILLHGRRQELLQHLGDLLPPAHSKAELNEWYKALEDFNERIDAHNMQCLKKMHIPCELVQQKCLAEVELCKAKEQWMEAAAQEVAAQHKRQLLACAKLLKQNVCTSQEAEEIVSSEFLQLTEELQRRFEAELQHLARDFQELAEETKQKCRELYSYTEGVLDLWGVHQQRVSQQQAELQKKLDECRSRQDRLLQMKEVNLDVLMDQMRTASSEGKLKQHLGQTLSSLDDLLARCETFKQVLMDELITYPEAVLQELISYSTSLSQYFHVKEIFKQDLEGETGFISADQDKLCFNWKEVSEASEVGHLKEQQAESIMQEGKGEDKLDGCQGEKGKPNTAENEKTFAEETEGREKEAAGQSIPHESEESEPAAQGAVLSSSEAESSGVAFETFSTSSGNCYTVLGVEEAGRTDTPGAPRTTCGEESLPVHLKHVLIKEAVLVELKKRLRLSCFEHLEQWFAESLANCHAFVAAKKEGMSSDLRLSLYAHQEMKEKIETKIYKLRDAELLLHKQQLECHCAEVVEALKKEKEDFLLFCDQQKKFHKHLQARMQDIESVFCSAPMNEKLVSFKANVHSELQIHLQVLQVSIRSYRSYLEDALGNIRDSNVDFLKACRLFSEGGSFSPEEVKLFSKRLQEQSKHIDSFESFTKAGLEQVESRCLEEATEVINQSARKFHYIFMNRDFMEKTQRALRHLRLQIKSEVANSNLQALRVNSCLEKLQQKIGACAHPAADKEALTSEELYEFIREVLKELKKRSQYLDCLLGKATTLPDSEAEARQGPMAPAEHLGDENKTMLMGLDPDQYPLLIPSRMGKPALEDIALGVIQNLLETQPSKKHLSLEQLRSQRSRSVLPSRKHFLSPMHGEDPQSFAASGHTAPSSRRSTKRKAPKGRKQKHSKPAPRDKRFQLFGEKPPESDTFKGIILNILWKGNESLFSLAEEFYQEQNPQITMLEDLPETFEDCAEIFEQNLLSYQSQTEEYHRSCLREFQDQLKLFEQKLSHISKLAVDTLLQEHQQKLSSATAQIQQLFSKQLEEWESAKALHKNQLHPSLGHPDNLLQLDALCQEEAKRQKDQADGICLHTQKLQDCSAECAQEFFSALAAFTEKLLLELDETVTTDDVKVVRSEREKTSTLLRCKLSELGACEVKQFIERGSRTWPGMPKTTLADHSDQVLCRETPPVTTAKTTLGHAAAVEARDAAYEKYRGEVEQQLAQVREESRTQLLSAQRWEAWWERSIQKLKHLYS